MTDGGSGRSWHVLLVGGASGTGKSTACTTLMQRYGVRASDIDDIGDAVRAMTTPEQQPELHHWSTHAETRDWTAEEILQLTLTVARTLAPAVRAVVDAHLDNGPPVIMEGDYLLPELTAGFDPAVVRSAFLHEPDESRLVANFSAREPGGEPQFGRARVSWLFGRWLVDEAARVSVPALPATPWSDLPDRIHAATRHAPLR